MPYIIGTWLASLNDPTVIDTEMKGGLHVVANATERLNIQFSRRKVGMRVAQADTQTVYRLLNLGSSGVALTESDYELDTVAAAGSTTQIQYNNNGAFAASSDLVFSGSKLGVGTANPGSLLQLGLSNQYRVYITEFSVPLPKYYLLGYISKNNGSLNIRGILGGHTILEGRATIDVTFTGRESFKAIGNVWGPVGTSANIKVYDDPDPGNNRYIVYLITDDYAAVNLDLAASEGATVNYDGTSTTTAPVFLQAFDLSVNVGQIIRSDVDGNVGIGIASPQVKLDLSTAADTTARLLASSNNVDTRINSVGGTGNAGQVGTWSNHPFIIRTNDDEKIRISNVDGSTRLLTTLNNGASSSPSLEVQGSYIRLGDGHTAATFTNGLGIKLHDQGTSHWSIGQIAGIFKISNTSNDASLFPATRNDTVNINSNGNVGIGTTDLQKKFQVANYVYLDNDTSNEYAVIGARAASGGGNRLHLSASTISLGMSLTAPFSERAYATIDANGLEFGRGAEKRIIFNSDANYTSDKAFILYKDESNYHFAGGGGENSRLSIGVYNDFDSTNGEGLDLQGGGSLIFNVGSWDTELNSSIGPPGGTISGNPIKFRINNSDIAYFSSAGNLTVNGTIGGTTIYGNGSGLTSIPNSSLVNNKIKVNETVIELGTTGSITVGDGGITDVYADDGTNLTNGGNTIKIYDPLFVDTANNRVDIRNASKTQRGAVTTITQEFQGNKLFFDGGLFQQGTTTRPWDYYNNASLQLHRTKGQPNDPRNAHLVLTQPEHDGAVGTAAQLYFGLDGSSAASSYSWIQSTNYNFGVSKPLSINPAGGNIGINKSTNLPNAQLDVNGNTIITGTLTVGSAGTALGTITAGSNGYTKIYDNNLHSTGSLNIKLDAFNSNLFIKSFGGSTEYTLGRFYIARDGVFPGPYTYTPNVILLNSTYATTNISSVLSVDGVMRVNLNGNNGGTAVYRDTNGYLTGPSPSDKRLKTNINNISNALEKISELNGVYYNWNCNNIKGLPTDSNLHVGLIAQEVEKVLPEVVYNTGIEDYKGVDYLHIAPLLVEGIKELKKENDQLKSTLNDVLARLAALENK